MPPGDSGLPIFGHLPALINDTESFFVKKIQRYGPIITMNALMKPVFFLSDEEDVRWAMNQERKGKTKAFILPHFQKLLGENSIMIQSGEAHNRLRKVFEPAFTPNAIRDYAPTIDSVVQKKLAQWCDSGEFQSPREWALLAMEIFFVCTFGKADKKQMEKLIFLFENWTKGFNSPVPLRIPGTRLAKAHGYKEQLGRLIKDMIEEFKESNPPDSDAAKRSVMGRLCYAMDEDGKMPSEEVLVDNLRFFLFAGFDTTKASFGSISYFLKQNPYVEKVLRDEVENFKNDVLDVDMLKNEAPILNAVLAETWRLSAPLSSHGTVTTEDLEYKGYHIPRGCFITTDIHGHALVNNDLYPNANEFHFVRWLPKTHPLYDPKKANTENIDYNKMSSQYRTFNHGPHMCLGAHFAKLEVRIVLTRLLQSYNFDIRNERAETFPLKQRLNDFKLSRRKA